MVKPKPWMIGSLELLNHAQGHLELGTSFDLRIAMVSTDVAVENMLKSYLSSPVEKKGVRHINREEMDSINKSFYSLLLGSQKYSVTKIEKDDFNEILWYHSIRNRIYHSGDGVTVDSNTVETYLAIAKNLFSNLFEERIEQFLESKPSTSIGEFFLLWREVMPQLERLANLMNLSYAVHDPRYMALPRLVARKMVPKSVQADLKEIREFRHDITHGDKEISQKEVAQKIVKLQSLLKTLKDVEVHLLTNKKEK